MLLLCWGTDDTNIAEQGGVEWSAAWRWPWLHLKIDD